jgi:hypothetical protein
MKFSVAVLLSAFASASAFAPSTSNGAATTKLHETKADLEALAAKANPIVNFYDPMDLCSVNFWDQGEAGAIGFLRHSEIKHGRVAMAAFVGYCVQSNFIFPWAQHMDGTTGPGTDLSPEEQWDSIPGNAKAQIFFLIAALELWDEWGGGEVPHYMRGRRPGQYPTFTRFRDDVHFALDLFDPFGLSKNRSEEAKAKGLIAEINNGRLAMIGIFGFVSADKVEGSVPLLKDIAIQYSGDVMAPFSSDFSWFN